MAHNINPDHASQRVDELADEIERRHEQQGREVHFGLDTGIAAHQLIEASQLVSAAGKRMADPLTLAFLMPESDAALFDKASDYSLKWVVGHKISAKVRALIARDGRSLEFARLYSNALHASTEAARADARAKLIKLTKPYFKKALASLIGDLEVYDPMNPNGPNGAWQRGR